MHLSAAMGGGGGVTPGIRGHGGGIVDFYCQF